MPLINCEVNLILIWSPSFDYHLILLWTRNNICCNWKKHCYVPVVTLSHDGNTKLRRQSGFKRTVNLNKYQSKATAQTIKKYLSYLNDPIYQGVNTRFALSFENNAFKRVQARYFLPTIERKDYNLMIDGRIFFDQSVKYDMRTYKINLKTANGQGGCCTTGYLLDYSYCKTYHKMIAIDLKKGKVLDADPEAKQQNGFTGNWAAIVFFIFNKANKTILNVS